MNNKNKHKEILSSDTTQDENKKIDTDNINMPNKATDDVLSENSSDNDIFDIEEAIKNEKLDDIVDYYKDIPYEEPVEQHSDLSDYETPAVTQKIAGFFKRKNKADSNIPENPDAIHDSGSSFSSRTKLIISYSLSGVVSIAIIAGAFLCAMYMPKNEEALNAEADKLRADESYTSLVSEYEELNSEVTNLRQSADEKKELAEGIDEYENTRASLRSQIEEKKSQLNDLNSQNDSLQTQINDLNAQIQNKVGSIVTLSAGRYTVGTDIAPGTYAVTGAEKFSVASSDGKSKYNEKLGTESKEVTLESGDKIKLDGTTKFSPLN